MCPGAWLHYKTFWMPQNSVKVARNEVSYRHCYQCPLMSNQQAPEQDIIDVLQAIMMPELWWTLNVTRHQPNDMIISIIRNIIGGVCVLNPTQ